MSAEKLLSTIGGPNKNLKKIHPGKIAISDLYVDSQNFVKSKEMYHSAHEYTKTLTNFGYGLQGQVQLTPGEMFIGNICLKMEFASGTYTFPPALAYNIIDEVRINLPGAQRVCKNGDIMFIQNMYEANTVSKRDSIIELAGGNVDVVNPVSNLVVYALLPILCSSVDEKRSYKWPIHLLNSNLDIQIKFKASSDVVKAGTAPSFVNAELFYERYNVFDPKTLKSKRDVYVLPYVEAKDYNFAFTGNATNPVTTRIDGVTEDAETTEFLINVNIDSDRATNKNSLTGVDIQQLVVRLADREIVKSDDDKFHKIRQLWNHCNQLEYTLSGATQRFFRVPFSDMPYKHQLQMHKYINGSDISQDDVKISFTSAAVASRLNIFVFKKKLITFHNGLVQNVR